MKQELFRTVVDVPQPPFRIEPFEKMLFVGSCFADAIGQRFADNKFRAAVNPYGVMYNPVSVLHTVERYLAEISAPQVAGNTVAADATADRWPRVVFITLGTNHVYRLRETGEIVDNCQKRPAALFTEEQLTVEQCACYLRRAVSMLASRRSDVNIVFTVSPIRYRKYGYHESQLSKATLLLAADRAISEQRETPADPQQPTPQLFYFPAYEIVTDELRDYRFYAPDMLHPSPQAVDYIWQRLVDTYFSPAACQFLREWEPLRQALAHRPLHPDSDEYRAFMEKTRQQLLVLQQRYPSLQQCLPHVS